MPARAVVTIGRPAGKSGLPAPIPGEPFSLIGTLRRTTSTLTVKDVATLYVCTEKTVHAAINRGDIPVVNSCLGVTRIDPKAWADLLEHDNPHLVRPRRTLRKVA